MKGDRFKNSHLGRFTLWIALMFAVHSSPGFGEGGLYRLAYRLRPEQTLRYTIEKQDSIVGGSGSQKSEIGSFYKIRQSLKAVKQDEAGPFWISLSTDSVWHGRSPIAEYNDYEKTLFEMEFKKPEEKLQLLNSGDRDQKIKWFTPLLIPLPQNPVAVDAGWNFHLEIPFDKPFNGSVRLRGNSQLYEVFEDGGDTLAVMMIQLDKTNSAQIAVKEPYQTCTTLYDAADKGTGVLYFSLTKGCVVKGILQWSGRVSVKGQQKSGAYLKKSKLTFRLLPVEKE